MTHESLCSRDWAGIIERLGGAGFLETSARDCGALKRARVVENAVMLLRLVLAYCLGQGQGLRSTAAWATAIGLVDISNVGLLYRVRRSGDWLALLVGRVLAAGAPRSSEGRLIRLIDGTAVPKAGRQDKQNAGLWRIHSAFDLPAERFGAFALTDETGGERLDRIPAVRGEIRIADRAYLQPDQIGAILDAGADLVIRAGWRNARWLDQANQKLDLGGLLENAAADLIDQPIWLGRKKGEPLAMRLVAARKPAQAAEAARRKARAESRRRGQQLAKSGMRKSGYRFYARQPALNLRARSLFMILD